MNCSNCGCYIPRGHTVVWAAGKIKRRIGKKFIYEEYAFCGRMCADQFRLKPK